MIYMTSVMQNKMPNNTKKGYVTDNFILQRTPTLPLLSSPHLPEEFNEPDRKKDKSTEKTLLMMVGIPLAVLGIGALGIKGFSRMVFKKFPMPKGDRPLNIGKNINIQTEEHFAAYRAIRDPNIKNIISSMAILVFSSGTFVLKNTIDGLQEIFKEKKIADIKRDYEEKMIEVETRSFSGKKQIIRYMLNNSEKDLEHFNKINKISFTSSPKEEIKKEDKEKKESEKSGIKPSHVLIGAIGIAGSAALLLFSIKNIKKFGKDINNTVKRVREGYIDSLKERKKDVINADQISQELIDLDYTNQKDLKGILKEVGFDEKTKKEILDKTTSEYAKTHPSQGVDGKKTVFAIINDVSGHFYNFITEPSKYTAALFATLTSISGLGYVGSKFVEANKEIQVEKSKKKIELNLNDRLVKVELKNFMTKKESAVNPLIMDYKLYAKDPGTPKEVLSTTYNGIFDEIKNGPPFIYE